MKIDLLNKQGYIEFVDMMPSNGSADMAVVQAARVSFNGDTKGEAADKKLLFYLMRHQHMTPFEMVQFKFKVHCPLFVARQWMRHRAASYNEISRRYTDESIEFYYPENWRKQSESNKQASDEEFSNLEESHILGKIMSINATGWDIETLSDLLTDYTTTGVGYYNHLVAHGVGKEMARMFLPPNLMTTFFVSVDARNLMAFIKLRIDSHAQYEIRVYAEALLFMLHRLMPWTAEAFEQYELTDPVTDVKAKARENIDKLIHDLDSEYWDENYGMRNLLDSGDYKYILHRIQDLKKGFL